MKKAKMTERINKPPARLSQYTVGDTVVLEGAKTELFGSFFIGEIEDGRYFLYNSKSTYEKQKLWSSYAASSHPVKESKCVRVESANQ